MINKQKEDEDPAVIREVLKIIRNSALGKNAHFHAADRNQLLNSYVGLPALLINIFLGSVLFYTLGQNIPDYTKWLGGILGFIAAGLTLCQIFFKFGNNFQAHRRIGNLYINLERESEVFISFPRIIKKIILKFQMSTNCFLNVRPCDLVINSC